MSHQRDKAGGEVIGTSVRSRMSGIRKELGGVEGGSVSGSLVVVLVCVSNSDRSTISPGSEKV